MKHAISSCHTVIVFCIVSLFIFSGCATTPGNQVAEQVIPLLPARQLENTELLNVSLQVFAPGELPADPDKKRGLSPEIREAEARFVPIHLKHTLQGTGYWGVVRVVPDEDIGAELVVNGTIIMSDGESIVLSVEAVDARNVVWFRRTYAETARIEEHQATAPEKTDAFQDLFNTIANDLAAYRNGLSLTDIAEIRQTARLKYGQFIAPDALDGYLATAENNRVIIKRLPAENDPMLARVEEVKIRDDLLVDVINDYYDIYYNDLWEPYANWRKFRQEEVSTLRRIEREALAKQVLGVTAIVGAIALGASTDIETSVRTQPLQELLIAGGAYAMYSGMQTHQEGQINKDAIEELGTSFSSEAEPLTLEVEGQAIRLTGSAEQQYSQWRAMLRQLYAHETGLIPADTTLSAPSTDRPDGGQ